MFGSKKAPPTDNLNVRVNVVFSADAYKMSYRLWSENIRLLHTDQSTQKDFLHFGYANPHCTVWLQCDQGTVDHFELIVRWEENKMHEIMVIYNTNQPTDRDGRAKALLNSMLTTPSIVLTGVQGQT